MTASPDTGTGRALRIQAAAGRHHTTTESTTEEDPMRTTSTQPADQPTDEYQALLTERFGPLADLTRERSASPAELIRLPQRRRVERRAAA